MEAAKDPRILERNMLQPAEFVNGVTVPITSPADKFSRTTTRVRTTAPSLGQHTDEILEQLGLDADARRRLEESGITS